jgi:hypothetical protein
VELRFDDYLDPAQEIAPGAVEIVDPTGFSVLVESVAVRPGGGQAGPGGALGVPGGAAAATPPLPSQELDVRIAPGMVLVAGTTYQVRVRGIVNLNGITGDSETTLSVPDEAPTPP